MEYKRTDILINVVKRLKLLVINHYITNSCACFRMKGNDVF
jgi:hypothetical protein